MMMSLSLLTACTPPATYKVDFWVDNAIVETYELKDGESASVPTAPAKTDYNFEYWLLEGTTTKYQPGDSVVVGTSDLKIVAIYTPVPKYTVSFYDDTTLVEQTSGLKSGENATAPSAPAKSGYTFVAWEIENTSTRYIAGQYVPVSNANIKLVAIYSQNKYTVSFYNGEDKYSEQTNLVMGSSVIAPIGPTKPGHEFRGWKVENTTTIYAVGDTITVGEANIKLVAVFEQIIPTYTVSFYKDGEIVSSDTFDDGEIVTMPTAPTKDGYEFRGWQLIGGDQTLYSVGQTVVANSDMIFAGYYVEITSDDLRVLYRVNGERYAVSYYEDGETIVWPSAPSVDNKVFVGWQDEDTLTIYTAQETFVLEGKAVNFVAIFDDAVDMAIYNEVDEYYADDDPYKDIVMDVVLGNMPAELYSTIGDVKYITSSATTTYSTTPSDNAQIPSKTVQGTGNVYVKGNVTFEFFTFKTEPMYFQGEWHDDNYIAGYLAYPTGAKAGDNLPGILLMHGGGGAGMGMLATGEKMAKRGYVVVSVDEPGVANPMQNYSDNASGTWLRVGYGSDRMTVKANGTIDVKASTLYTATTTAIKAFSILYNSPLVDKAKVGLTGMSWGGYLTTYLTGALGSMVEAASSCWGCGFYEEEGNFDTELNALPTDEYNAFIKYLDAGRRADNAKAHFFLGAANNDNWFRPQMVMNTLEAMTDVQSKAWFFAPNKNHNANEVPGGTGQGGMGSFLSDDFFFDYYLKGEGSAPSQISYSEEPSVTTDGQSILVKFQITVPSGLTLKSDYIKFYYALLPTSGKWIDRVYVDYSSEIEKLGQVGDTYYYQVALTGDLTADDIVFYASIADSRPFTVSTMMKSTTGMIDHKVYNEVATHGGVSVSTQMIDSSTIKDIDTMLTGSVVGADKVKISVGYQSVEVDVVDGNYSAKISDLFNLEEDKTYTVSVRPLVDGEVVMVDEDTLVGVSRQFTYDLQLNATFMTGTTVHTLNINTQGDLKVILTDDIISSLVGECTMRVTTYKLDQSMQTKTLVITSESVSPTITVSVTDNNGQDIPPSDWVVVVDILDADSQVLRSVSIESGLKGGYIT